MKAVFIQQDGAFKGYGIMMLSAYLKKRGYATDIIIESLEKNPWKELLAANPDIICFSVTAAHYKWLLKATDKIKRMLKRPIIIGGPLPTFYPEIIINKNIDIICIGEGELALAELLKKMENDDDITKIGNLWVKIKGRVFRNPVRNLINDLDILPFPDRNIYEKYRLFARQKYDIFLAGLGCLSKCTFCYNKKYNDLYANKGKILRRRSVDNLIEEFRQIKKHINRVAFLDNDFLSCSKKWIDEFSIKYKNSVNIPFVCSVRADFVTEESIRKLKTAGCMSIRMGIESGDSFIRQEVVKKGLTKAQIINAANIIKKNKINLQLNNILGLPGETLNSALNTYEMSYKLHPVHAWCSLIALYPGTELVEIAKQYNLITGSFDIKNVKSSFFNSLPYEIDKKKEIINLQRLFQLGNKFRINKNIMRYLINFPNNRVFELLFKASYMFAAKKMLGAEWRELFNIGRVSNYCD